MLLGYSHMRIKAIVIIAVLFGTVFIIGGSAQTGFANKAFADRYSNINFFS